VLALIAALAALVAISYNQLLRLRNKVEEAWYDVDVQLERRHHLIPRLVETVKGYAAHERELFDELARLRSEAVEAVGAGAKSAPEAQLARALERVIALAESYPGLRASENFLSLQREISHTEDEVAASRHIYNSNVRIYNNRVQTAPVSWYADLLGFESAEFFQAGAGERGPIAVAT
jgi:LemA protein